MSKILIVDDNVSLSFLLKSFLEEKHYDVIVAHSGMDALEKIKTLKPDIMLLDIMMEGIGGMEVLKRTRQFNNNIGIIMVSALIDDALHKKALEDGADEFIIKPIDYNHLHECILVDLIMRNKQNE